jgi:hypothetical protein
MKASRFRQLHAAPHGVFKTAGALVAAGPKIRAVNGTKVKQGLQSHQANCATAQEASRMADDYCGRLLEPNGCALELIPDSGVSPRMSRPLDIKLICLRLCVLPFAEPHS